MRAKTGIRLTLVTTLRGTSAGVRLGAYGTSVLGNGNYVVRSPSAAEGGVINVGTVRLMSGVTGAELIPALTGDTTGDQVSSRLAAPAHGGFFVVAFPFWDNGSLDSGRVRLIAE